MEFVGKAVFAYGCNMHEHAIYGMCLDGLCGKRGQWEETLLLQNDEDRLVGDGTEYVSIVNAVLVYIYIYLPMYTYTFCILYYCTTILLCLYVYSCLLRRVSNSSLWCPNRGVNCHLSTWQLPEQTYLHW